MNLHPLNRDFTWIDHVGPFRRLTTEQASQFDEQGFFVLDDAVDVTRITRELDAFEAATDAFLAEQHYERVLIAERGAITFTPHVATRSKVARAFATSPLFADLAFDLLGPDVDFYWDQAVYKKPEKPRRFPWHQDNGYTFVEPQQYLTCWVALTDATLDNGCPWIAPGLHRQGTLAHRYVDPLGFECFDEPPSKIPAPVRAGGVVVFSSLTPHLTGPNLTDETRKAYILQYAPANFTIREGNRPRHFPLLRDGSAV